MSIWDPKETLDAIGLGRQEQKRSKRVGDAIRNELAVLLLSKARDPQLAEVNISRVEVTDDLKLARIYFTTLSGKSSVRRLENALQRAKGFMRSHVARTLNLRFTPELQFRYDDTADKVARIESIFQEIANERKGSDEDT